VQRLRYKEAVQKLNIELKQKLSDLRSHVVLYSIYSHVHAGGKVPEGVGPVKGLEVVEGAGVVVQQVAQEGRTTPPGCGCTAQYFSIHNADK